MVDWVLNSWLLFAVIWFVCQFAVFVMEQEEGDRPPIPVVIIDGLDHWDQMVNQINDWKRLVAIVDSEGYLLPLDEIQSRYLAALGASLP